MIFRKSGPRVACHNDYRYVTKVYRVAKSKPLSRIIIKS